MATLRKEILIDTTPEAAWDALRDVGALHTRLASGFVTDTKVDGNAREHRPGAAAGILGHRRPAVPPL
jgi:hypothetical protein